MSAKKTMPEIDETSLKLLSELGLSALDSELAIREKIESLNMRQLDRLKLMIGREASRKDIFSLEIALGVKNNDYASFSRAVLILIALMKKHN